MAVNVPNPGIYFNSLGAHAVLFRDALQALLNDASYLNSMGGSAFLQGPPFNLSPADADHVNSVIGAVTESNTTVQAVQAFIESTEFLWGGQ